MKKAILIVLVGLMTFSLVSIATAGVKPEVSADLGVFNKYVWRGMVLNEEAVLQPGASVEFMGFGLGVWGNMDLTDVNDGQTEFNEIDYTLSYSLGVPKFDLSFGLIYYDFPNTESEATTELFVEATASVLLSPSVAIYTDIDQIKGSYIALGASHGIALNPTLDLVFDAALGLATEGYTEGYFDVEAIDPTDATAFVPGFSTGLNTFAVTASVPFSIIPMIEITPSVTYQTLLGDAKDNFDSDPDQEIDALVFGVNANFTF